MQYFYKGKASLPYHCCTHYLKQITCFLLSILSCHSKVVEVHVIKLNAASQTKLGIKQETVA